MPERIDSWMTPSEARAILDDYLASLKRGVVPQDTVHSVNFVQSRQRDSERLGGPARKRGAHRVKLIIGNRNYSSWSLRGWLAAKQSGLSFETLTVHIDGDDWQAMKKHEGDFQPSAGKVPVLWDGDVVVWDSLAILEYLGDKVGRDRFWPKDDAARGMARAMVAEMHSSYLALRRLCPMNIRKRVDSFTLTDEARADIVRMLGLWAEARARFGKGGPFLFGSFSAVDVFYAPVITRFVTYGIGVPGFAQVYMQAVWEHEWMQEWIHAAEDEQWVIEQFETA
jgi:glutathione S-transferase